MFEACELIRVTESCFERISIFFVRGTPATTFFSAYVSAAVSILYPSLFRKSSDSFFGFTKAWTYNWTQRGNMHSQCSCFLWTIPIALRTHQCWKCIVSPAALWARSDDFTGKSRSRQDLVLWTVSFRWRRSTVLWYALFVNLFAASLITNTVLSSAGPSLIILYEPVRFHRFHVDWTESFEPVCWYVRGYSCLDFSNTVVLQHEWICLSYVVYVSTM